MTTSFEYKGRKVEITPERRFHNTRTDYLLEIDGIQRGDYFFSQGSAETKAKQLIDAEVAK
jgi:hypothetical protein